MSVIWTDNSLTDSFAMSSCIITASWIHIEESNNPDGQQEVMLHFTTPNVFIYPHRCHKELSKK